MLYSLIFRGTRPSFLFRKSGPSKQFRRIKPYNRPMMRAVVITVSDSRSSGAQEDRSGPAVEKVLNDARFAVVGRVLVPDEQPEIEAALVEQTARAELVVTTGGTGIATRDVTPEAAEAVCERMLPGFGERMRSAGSTETPLAYLSRAVAGTRGRSLIVTLPGSPQGAVTSLRAVMELIPHALALLAGEGAAHTADSGDSTEEQKTS